MLASNPQIFIVYVAS